MPKGIIAAIKRGYAGSGLSEDEINHRVYGRLNNQGLMHGSQETDAGVSAESKFERDHGRRATEKARTTARGSARARKFLTRSTGSR